MRKPKIDLTGKKFGRLTVTGYGGNGKWLCECECGNSCYVLTASLNSNKTQSCGCLQRDRASESNMIHGAAKGYKKERLYTVWHGMKQRCGNPHHKHYRNYGGRGIKVCHEWQHDYESFRKWAYESGYDPKARRGQLTIDRIDVNGDYEPNNCRFITMSEQARNRRKFKCPNKRKAVELIDVFGNVIDRFDSIDNASKATGCAHGSISRVCKGKLTQTHGMRWRYA